jgi:hypothetical protein
MTAANAMAKDMTHAMTVVEAARDELRAERDAVRAQLDTLQEARRQDAEESGRVRGRLELAEAELARLREMPPAPVSTLTESSAGRPEVSQSSAPAVSPEEISRLQGRLEALEAEAERARQAPPVVLPPPTPDPPPRRRRWPWAR